MVWRADASNSGASLPPMTPPCTHSTSSTTAAAWPYRGGAACPLTSTPSHRHAWGSPARQSSACVPLIDPSCVPACPAWKTPTPPHDAAVCAHLADGAPSASSRTQRIERQKGSHSKTNASSCSTSPFAPPWTSSARRAPHSSEQYACPPRSAGGVPSATHALHSATSRRSRLTATRCAGHAAAAAVHSSSLVSTPGQSEWG
mmetsp:Transcript_28439/g.70674  ORF Transcript_28439/g.70674 Transcript_28439/m.70674 type:complete len:202 (-) Transcript_28439:223-828(-)